MSTRYGTCHQNDLLTGMPFTVLRLLGINKYFLMVKYPLSIPGKGRESGLLSEFGVCLSQNFGHHLL